MAATPASSARAPLPFLVVYSAVGILLHGQPHGTVTKVSKGAISSAIQIATRQRQDRGDLVAGTREMTVQGRRTEGELYRSDPAAVDAARREFERLVALTHEAPAKGGARAAVPTPKYLLDAARAAAQTTARVYADQYPGQRLDPTRTDWDGVAWRETDRADVARRVGRPLTEREVDRLWPVYQRALVSAVDQLHAVRGAKPNGAPQALSYRMIASWVPQARQWHVTIRLARRVLWVGYIPKTTPALTLQTEDSRIYTAAVAASKVRFPKGATVNFRTDRPRQQ